MRRRVVAPPDGFGPKEMKKTAFILAFCALALCGCDIGDERFRNACSANGGRFDPGGWLYQSDVGFIRIEASCVVDPKEQTLHEWLVHQRLAN